MRPHIVDIPDDPTVSDRPPADDPADERPPRSREDAATRRRRPRTTKIDRLQEDISGLYSTAGGLVLGWGLAGGSVPRAAAGVNIINHADDAASAWLDLAERNHRVRELLERVTETSVLAGIVGVHVAMLAPIAASMGVLNPFIADKLAGGSMAEAQDEVLAAMGITREQYTAAAAAANGGHG